MPALILQSATKEKSQCYFLTILATHKISKIIFFFGNDIQFFLQQTLIHVTWYTKPNSPANNAEIIKKNDIFGEIV